ncbi:A24 family peptidase [Photobacterium sp. MCCC 1A19761]|uniref:A24 family peptidase n=1 Tax=Photobacterium sp. MCCC 1A19761 TaxID=3115000 RepID=UPI00307E7BAF
MDVVIISVLFYAALYDIRENKIPNLSVVAIIALSLLQPIYQTMISGTFNFSVLLDPIFGLFISFTICFLLYLTGLFGAGDAKLLASLGATVGFPHLLLLVATAISIAGILSLLRVACYGELFDLLKRWYQTIFYNVYQPPEINSVASSAIPMGGAILLATLYCHFYLF